MAIRESVKPFLWIGAAALALWLLFSSSGRRETDLETVLSGIDGAGRVMVYTGRTQETASVFSESAPTSGGIVIVAQGAQDPAVSFALADAACAALDLSPGQVSVQVMKP